MKKIFIYILIGFAAISCSRKEDLLSESVVVKDQTPRNELDEYLLKNFTYPFNIEVKYRLDDSETDLGFNVVPAEYDKAVILTKLLKYLWLDVYSDRDIAPADFLPKYCPKNFVYIGSLQYESDGTVKLGQAEGGMTISLLNVNNLDAENINIEYLNNYYFVTMHHEFAHILHQTKLYDTAFRNITKSSYTGQGWINVSDQEANKMGFVTNYASSAVDEDFVETLAHYVTMSDDSWNKMLAGAGTTGAGFISQKLSFVKEYMITSWNIDLDKVRAKVQSRQANISSLDLKTLN